VIIGLDFDNTLICYDELFHRLAMEAGVACPASGASKRAIRDLARRSPGADATWQRLQGLAYGPRIQEAHLFPGLRDFFERCVQEHADLVVVSHKTEYASDDATRTPLRTAALDWMDRQGLFHFAAGVLKRGSIHFCASREYKVARIRELGCTWFVDDLEETFLEPNYPREVRGIFFAPEGPRGIPHRPEILWAESWEKVAGHVFAD
jgi:hypothetical protein